MTYLKELTIAGMLCTVSLTGCTTTDGSTTQNPLTQAGISLFQSTVKQKCQSEIVEHRYWRVISTMTNASVQAKISDTVCGCVSEHALQQVSLSEVATAVVDSNARPKIVSKAVKGSIQACATDYIQKSPFAGLIK